MTNDHETNYHAQVQTKFKHFCYKFELNDCCSETALKILRLAGEGHYQKQIASALSLSKSDVSYHIKKFLKKKLLKKNGNTKPLLYDLTPLSSKLLTWSERGFCEPFVLESYALKFPLLRDNSNIDWKKLGKPNNWEKFGSIFFGCRVEKNLGKQPTVIIRTERVCGFSDREAFALAGAKIQAVRAWLAIHGVHTSANEVEVGDPNLKFYTPEAELLHDEFGNITTDCGIIDDSPPEKMPHEERSRRQQVDYLNTPLLVRKLSASVEKQSAEIKGQKEEITGLKEVVAQLVELERERVQAQVSHGVRASELSRTEFNPKKFGVV
jgi:DNA-binding MarR family transcriptional regulator